MRREILMIVMLFYVLCVSACVKADRENRATTESTGNVKETEKETETQVEEETLYDFRNDSNVLYADIYGQHDLYGQRINGIDVSSPLCDVYYRGMKTEVEGQLIVGVNDDTGELTGMELYEGYVKGLNVKTEFYGVSEETIKRCLTERDEYRKKQEMEYGAYIFVFVTEEELKDILEKGCPEGMQLSFNWVYRG